MRRDELVLHLNGELARAGEDLPRDEKRLRARRQSLPRQRAGQEIILVAAVAVAAEVGVVLVEPHRRAARLGETLRAGHHHALARAVVRDQLGERGALGRAVFGVGVVVVEARAVAEREVALDLGEGQLAVRVLLEVIRLVEVLPQLGHIEPPVVVVRVLGLVIPAHPHTRLHRAAHQRDGLRHHVQVLHAIPRDAVFGLNAEEDGRGFSHRWNTDETRMEEAAKGNCGPYRVNLSLICVSSVVTRLADLFLCSPETLLSGNPLAPLQLLQPDE